MLETNRLIIRPWKLSDLDRLYELAKDPDVGPTCGWLPHTCIMESEIILEDVLMNDETFAICLKDGTVIGNISIYKDSIHVSNEFEKEIGFWIGKKYWNQGYASEACIRMIQYGFDELKLDKIWCCHYVDNFSSKRVQEKCGFKYSHTYEYYSKTLGKNIISDANYIKKADF